MRAIIEPLVLVILGLSDVSLADEFVAESHVTAAVAASEETGYDPELLLALAYVESRFNPRMVSRVERRGKVFRYCGPTQVGGRISKGRCRRLQDDLDLNYLEGAKHLRFWERAVRKKHRRCRQSEPGSGVSLRCALRGYNAGWGGLGSKCPKWKRKDGCHYQRRVLEVMGTIQDYMGGSS